MSDRRHQKWHPPKYSESGEPGTYSKADMRAIQALAIYAESGGEAPGQGDVRRALDWIINQAARTYDEPFEAGRPDVSNYLLGRRSVGLAIVKLIKLRPGIFDKDQT